MKRKVNTKNSKQIFAPCKDPLKSRTGLSKSQTFLFFNFLKNSFARTFLCLKVSAIWVQPLWFFQCARRVWWMCLASSARYWVEGGAFRVANEQIGNTLFTYSIPKKPHTRAFGSDYKEAYASLKLYIHSFKKGFQISSYRLACLLGPIFLGQNPGLFCKSVTLVSQTTYSPIH